MVSTKVMFPGYKQKKPTPGNLSTKEKGCFRRLLKKSPGLWVQAWERDQGKVDAKEARIAKCRVESDRTRWWST